MLAPDPLNAGELTLVPNVCFELPQKARSLRPTWRTLCRVPREQEVVLANLVTEAEAVGFYQGVGEAVYSF